MARIQLFLSCVTAEFKSYREVLRHALTRPNVEVKVQEDFIVSGETTLQLLDDYIQQLRWGDPPGGRHERLDGQTSIGGGHL